MVKLSIIACLCAIGIYAGIGWAAASCPNVSVTEVPASTQAPMVEGCWGASCTAEVVITPPNNIRNRSRINRDEGGIG